MNPSKPYVLPEGWEVPDEKTIQLISDLIGKVPQGEFQIVARTQTGSPLIIENAPFFYDGTPMPTRYWLVDPEMVADISRLESAGAVKRVQVEIDPETIMNIHKRHEVGRDMLILPTYEGPRPTGGVGGTRKGVKCLHTHVANYLASGNDEIGVWAIEEVQKMKAKT